MKHGTDIQTLLSLSNKNCFKYWRKLEFLYLNFKLYNKFKRAFQKLTFDYSTLKTLWLYYGIVIVCLNFIFNFFSWITHVNKNSVDVICAVVALEGGDVRSEVVGCNKKQKNPNNFENFFSFIVKVGFIHLKLCC